MADSPAESEPPAQVPLLGSTNSHAQLPPLTPQPNGGGDCEDNDLDETLRRLDVFLSILGFNQSSVSSSVFAWIAFVLIGIVLPVFVLELSDCVDCQKYQYKNFELNIVASQACLAGVSLICVSHNLRKHGTRKFLFVDQHSGRMGRLKDRYIKQISDSVRLLVIWSLPCFTLKTAREIIRILYVTHESWWLSLTISLALLFSWTYLCTIYLAACAIFHLVCNLQVIHFEDYAKLMETESDVSLFIYEHVLLRHYLSKISHRFRIFLLLQFLVVTASQLVTLVQITGYGEIVTFINGGDFAVSSIVQVVGIILCLHAATRISHRAQAIASLASKWHAVMTCASIESPSSRGSPNGGHLETARANRPNSLPVTYSDSDLGSMEYVAIPTNNQLASYLSSYHRRQAFVMYLQSNPGGITIFGWTVDRSLINTIFFIELTLVTFLLGMTLVF